MPKNDPAEQVQQGETCSISSDDTLGVSENEQFEQAEARIKSIRIKFWEAKRRLKKKEMKISIPSLPRDSKRQIVADSVKTTWAIEVFCGSGRLAKALQEFGFNALGVDYSGNKDQPECNMLTIDLLTDAGKLVFWRLVKDNRVKYVHFGPPCGTASKAREIRRVEGPDPKPLRSDTYPNGLLWLSGLDAEKVRKANGLYSFTADSAKKLTSMGISWSIENPRNSYMWDTSWFSELFDWPRHEAKFHKVSFHSCMHGGSRDKATTFWYNGCDLSSLQVWCDKSHQHKPWGLIKNNRGQAIFATAEERRYPRELCQKIAVQVQKSVGVATDSLKKDGGVSIADGPQDVHVRPRQSLVNQSDKASVEIQARRATNSLISEYKESTRLKSDESVPSGWVLLSGHNDGEQIGESEYGVPWSPQEFLQKALAIKHPFDLEVKVAPEVALAWTKLLSISPEEVDNKRKAVISYYEQRWLELSEIEAKLHFQLDPQVERVISKKSILLF